MVRQKSPWWKPIKMLDAWAHEIDWEAHISALNQSYGFKGKQELSTSIKGWPPAWFTGNMEALQPDKWVLVVSINPARPISSHYGNINKRNSWHFWCEHNRDPRRWDKHHPFFPRLANLARNALPNEVAVLDDATITSDHMLFLEFCPYASVGEPFQSWAGPGRAQEVANGDIGFAINRQIRHLAFLHGRPRIALVQGAYPAYDVKDFQCPSLSQQMLFIGETEMKVWQGSFHGANGAVPILGFPFLAAQTTLQLEPRMNALGRHIRMLVEAKKEPGP
jgi:hypothetical protein